MPCCLFSLEWEHYKSRSTFLAQGDPVVDMARHCYSLFFCVRLLIYVKAIQGDFPAGLQDSYREQSGYSKRYINSWAVEVRSGKLHADEVARRNGFENRGRVS